MAECHPVGFQWVTEAQKRGARVIHVDPRFTRTSAVADKHVALRAGSDIALLGALIAHEHLGAEQYLGFAIALAAMVCGQLPAPTHRRKDNS